MKNVSICLMLILLGSAAFAEEMDVQEQIDQIRTSSTVTTVGLLLLSSMGLVGLAAEIPEVSYVGLAFGTLLGLFGLISLGV